MTNPSTFKGEPQDTPQIEWNDAASLHRSADGGGVLTGLKAVRQGALSELVRQVMQLPEADQGAYQILKAGDHVLQIGEIRALYRRPDFPKAPPVSQSTQ